MAQRKSRLWFALEYRRQPLLSYHTWNDGNSILHPTRTIHTAKMKEKSKEIQNAKRIIWDCRKRQTQFEGYYSAAKSHTTTEVQPMMKRRGWFQKKIIFRRLFVIMRLIIFRRRLSLQQGFSLMSVCSSPSINRMHTATLLSTDIVTILFGVGRIVAYLL